MRFEILGSPRLVDGERIALVSGRRKEIILGLLLIRANRVVSVEDLIAEVWGEHPPMQARAGLYVAISHLRKLITAGRREPGPIVTRSNGYLFELADGELDVQEFVRLAEDGRAHVKTGRYEEAARAIEHALALWRGPVLGNVHGSQAIGRYATWLMELRLECTEVLADVQLELGRHRELVADLFALTAEHPLREGFYRQLMLALYRCDRKADALSVYHSARRTLQTELGLEPCRSVQDLHRAILMSDAVR